MGVVLKQIDKQYGTRPLMTAIIGAGVIAFLASSKLDHKTLFAAISLSSALTVVLTSFGGSLREISPALQRWSVYVGCAVTGATFGLVLRAVLR